MRHFDLGPSEDANADEVLDVLGPRIRFVTALSDRDNDYCLIAADFPTGIVVPVHSHAERETFYLLQGEMQVLWENRWTTLSAGAVFDVPGDVKHALRNVSGASASLLLVTLMRHARFLRDIGRPAALAGGGAPTPADLQRLVEASRAYGYWRGSPADNSAVGISLG
ncbi:MAG: cupin domain-containing protein [Hyphomicrobiales bacterium]|nr:cupin domain-containing protein [Hyphomicrobiales bacterium]